MASSRSRWFGLVFISIGVSMIIIDSTIVNVAIPSIVDDLGLSSSQVQWVQESYTLVFAALLIVFGTLADRIGRRRMLVMGVAIFSLASIACALAPTGDLLILARVIQGVGGAMVLPTTLSLINANFRGRERGIAFAIWGSTIGGMAAVGPLLGGWLTTSFSWNWAFGINVPIGVIVIIGVLAFVPESKEPSNARGIDVVGAVLSVLAAGSLVFGLIEGRNYGWWTATDGLSFFGADWPFTLSPIPLVFLVAVLSAGAFVWWGLHRQRTGQTSMIPLDLFTIASFRNGNIAALVVSLGEFGIVFSLPLWLQNVLGYTALQSGFVLLGLAIGSFVASGFATALTGRLSAVAIVRVGIVSEIIGVVGVGFVVSPTTEWWALVPFLFVYGFGIGLASAQLAGVVLQDVPIAKSGQASGTQSTARQIGSALGIAVLGTILFTTAGNTFDSDLSAQGVPDAERTKLVSALTDSAGGIIPSLSENPQTAPFADDAKQSFSTATQYAAWSAGAFLALGLLATLTLGGRPREDD